MSGLWQHWLQVYMKRSKALQFKGGQNTLQWKLCGHHYDTLYGITLFIIGFDWFDFNFRLNKKLCHPYSVLKSVLMVSIFIGALEITMQQLNIEHVNQRNINIFLLVLLIIINWNAWRFPSCDFWFQGLEPMQVEHV
jgi:hypothetical protein